MDESRDKTNKKDNRTSFRLPVPLHEKLLRLAEDAGVSHHDYAQSLVILMLHAERDPGPEIDPEGLQDALRFLATTLDHLRLVFGRGVGAILQDVSPGRDKDEIRQWVHNRIIASPEAPPKLPELASDTSLRRKRRHRGQIGSQ